MRNIYISIINFNGKANTIECLKTLDSLKIDSFTLRVLVVDNASKEDFRLENIQYKNFIATVFYNNQNLGFTGGHNMNIRYAQEHGADYVVILNNDTIVDKNLIKELLRLAEKNSSIGIVAPKIYFTKGHEFHKERYSTEELGTVFWYAGGIMDWKNVVGKHRGVDEVDRGQYEKEEATDFASGCCMMIKKQVLQKIGYFDDKYFLYYEDSDLCERARGKNFVITYCPKAILWHKNAGSVGGSGSQMQDYYITRNRLLFGTKYAPLRSKIALYKQSLRFLLNGREWQKRGVRDFYLKKLGKGSYD